MKWSCQTTNQITTTLHFPYTHPHSIKPPRTDPSHKSHTIHIEKSRCVMCYVTNLFITDSRSPSRSSMIYHSLSLLWFDRNPRILDSFYSFDPSDLRIQAQFRRLLLDFQSSDPIPAWKCLRFTGLVWPPSRTPRRRVSTVMFARYAQFHDPFEDNQIGSTYFAFTFVLFCFSGFNCKIFIQFWSLDPIMWSVIAVEFVRVLSEVGSMRFCHLLLCDFVVTRNWGFTNHTVEPVEWVVWYISIRI